MEAARTAPTLRRTTTSAREPPITEIPAVTKLLQRDIQAEFQQALQPDVAQWQRAESSVFRRFPLGALRRKDVLDALKHGNILGVQYVESSRTVCAVLVEGRSGLRLPAIFKPTTHDHIWLSETGSPSVNEVFAYEWDLQVGAGLVPPTVFRKLGNAPGTLQLALPQAYAVRDVPNDYRLSWESACRAAVFVALIQDGDKFVQPGHPPRNVLVQDVALPSTDGVLVLIDNKLAFSNAVPPLSPQTRLEFPVGQLVRTEGDEARVLEWVAQIDPANAVDLAREYGVRRDSVEVFRANLETLKKNPTLALLA